MPAVYELAPDVRVYSLVKEETSHLVVRNGRSLLIDCHSAQMRRWLACCGLPAPLRLAFEQALKFLTTAA
jgi:hypothetical protein